METEPEGLTWMAILPLLLWSVITGPIAHALAKEKGRAVGMWTILGLIPGIGIFFVWFFIGAANLIQEQKLDQILAALEKQGH